MPSEAQQSKLKQPWKQYHTSLNPWSRKDVRDGNVVLVNADSAHGTTSIDQKKVDLKVDKEIPKMYVRLRTIFQIKTEELTSSPWSKRPDGRPTRLEGH